MYCNIMETYVKFTEKNILDYLKIILDVNYDKKIAVELTKAYINARYYGYNQEELQKISKNVFNSLKLKYDKLKIKFPKKEKIVLETFYLFKYIFYIDELKENKTLEEVVDAINTRRINKYKIQKDTGFKKQFAKRVEKDCLKRKEFLNKFNTEQFELIINNNIFIDNLYDVSIKNNIKFKDIFKEEAIESIFNKRVNCGR